MATHKRTQIRNAAVSMLNGHVTEVGSRVFKSRNSNLWPDQELPAICISSAGDKVIERMGTKTNILTRTFTLIVEAIVTGDPLTNDDVLDSICKQIEDLFGANQNLSGTCDDLELDETIFGFKEDGERPLGAARMTYQITYVSGE